MGTHPIFESDFDCLTEKWAKFNGLLILVGDTMDRLLRFPI